MKCSICNSEYWLEEIEQLFFVQHLCNNCNNLFQYNVKSVKIKTLVCVVHFFKNLKSVLLYTNSSDYDKINTCLIDENSRNRKYYTVVELKILLLEKRIKYYPKMIIFFYRKDYYELLKIVSYIIKRKLTKKIIIYELIK